MIKLWRQISKCDKTEPLHGQTAARVEYTRGPSAQRKKEREQRNTSWHGIDAMSECQSI